MRPRIIDNDRFRTASQYLAAVLLSLSIVFLLLKLYRADFKVPLHYNGDALLHSMFIKGIIDNGWYWQNPSLGAPNGLEMYDFPAVDNSGAAIIALLGLFTKDPYVVLNIFYLLTFPLVTISALFALRQLNFSYATALFGSLLYTFLPYHFMRGESHLFLSAYYFIPLVVLVLVWIASDQLSGGRGWFGMNLRSSRFILSIVICVLVGSNSVYYPFFASFLLMVAGLSAAVVKRNWKPLAPAVLLVVVTFGVVLVNLAPSIVYISKQGDARVTERSLAGPEVYSLKISQLLLPITGHRFGPFNRLKNLYNQNTNVTESDAAALGLVGSIGFLVLLARLFFPRSEQNALLADLSVLNIFAVLLGTIGGFGSLFALFVSPAIRSYNRISVFIAFFSLLAVVIGLEWFYKNRVRSGGARIVFYVSLGIVLTVALLDQTSRSYVPQYAEIKPEFRSDEDFVRLIDSGLPNAAMVFQLPYVPFPEHPRVNKMVDYDHLRGYLHSRDLRWSYGAMKNRPGDLWVKQVAALPLDQMVQSLAFAGFDGIYLDRNGYNEDDAATIEARLGELLQIGPIVSENGRLLFFKTTDYNSRLRQTFSETEWLAKQEITLHPLLVEWRGGFSGLETSAEKNWRWCSNAGELHIFNTHARKRKVRVEMYFATGHEQFSDLKVSGASFSDQLKVNTKSQFYSKTIEIPPGESVIKFASNAPRVNAPLDPRYLVFRVEEFKLTEEESN